jgi:hypothetical protein
LGPPIYAGIEFETALSPAPARGTQRTSRVVGCRPHFRLRAQTRASVVKRETPARDETEEQGRRISARLLTSALQ